LTRQPGPRLTLPASWYHDDAIWQAERQGIFRREWLWVACAHQLSEPGSYVTAQPAGFPVFVRRDARGELSAFHNVCRHRAMKILPAEAGNCKELVCPYHGWRYRDDGSLAKATRFGDEGALPPGRFGLFSIRVQIWQGLVFICMDEDAPSFEDWLGPLKSRIDNYLVSPRVYHGDVGDTVACNWKNYVDNYQEGYHIPLVHRQLAADVDWPSYRVVNVGAGSVHEVPARGDSGQPGLFGWKFPNLMFNTYGQGVSFMRVEPEGPLSCRVHYSHFRPENMAAGEYDRMVVDYGWTISLEDQFITPLVQQNLEAGVYQAGPLSPLHENGLLLFHDLVRRAVEPPVSTQN
jgi:phenylpropionate dioxygenase-like ring-hydroxylating dioxygenase large terminal subunit